MKMKSNAFKLLFLLMLSNTVFSEESVYEKANKVAWKTFNSSESMKDGSEAVSAESIEAKIKSFIDAGNFAAIKSKAVKVAESARNASLDAMNLNPPANKEEAIDRLMSTGKFYVFISNSMPKGQTASLLKSLQNTPYNVEIAYRGLFQGNRTISDFTRQAGRQLRDMGIKEMNAMIGLNPTAFREFGVTKVPALVYVHDDKSSSKITGIVNLELFKYQLNETGKDLGNDGSTFEIEEKDFFVEIQERMSKIDWDKKAKKVEQAYWDSHKSYDLPVSYQSSFHDLDMSVVVSENIYAEYGGKKHVIARAGDQFNPMLQSGFERFNRRILILNPNDERQVVWAKDQVEEALKNNERPVVMLTAVLENNKKQTLSHLEEILRVQIYLLQDAIVDRFNVNRIPAMIKKSVAHEGHMRVSYYSCEENGCYE